MEKHIVIEWAPFRLAEGVGEAQLLAASRALQTEFLASQPGFVRRELLRGKDGEWVDLVYWEDKAAADAVMQAAAESSVCRRYFHLMEGAENMNPDTAVSHFTRVASYGRG